MVIATQESSIRTGRDDGYLSHLGHPTYVYAYKVLKDEIPAGKWLKKLCERHIRDLRYGYKRDLYFDYARADHAIKFFSFLKHYKGEWAGKTIVLELWQKFIIGCLFGWRWLKTGFRRFRVAYIEVPRKNGKSLLAAAVALYLAFFDKEPGAEVYCAATKRDQAKIVWNDAKQLVQRSEDLKKRLTVYGGERGIGVIFNPTTASKLIPLGADSDSTDGLNSSGLIVDELHAHKTRGLWDVLQTSTGSRRQPLTLAITTAGSNRFSVCFEQHDYGTKILDGVFNDDSFFPYIACPDDEDDWTSEETWAKANPNIGVSVKIEDLRVKCEKAKHILSEQNEFLQKHLDIWTERESKWLSLEVFDQNTDEPDIEELKKRDCYAGLDLSTTQDLSALELYFPGEGDEEGGDWLHYYFVPEATMRERIERDRVPYDLWVRQGYLIATPGNVVDYDFIRETLNSLKLDGFRIKEVGYDPFNAMSIVTDLQSDGFTCVPIRQSFLSLSPPTKEFERLLLGNKMRIGKNPVTRWAASNAVTIRDSVGNIKLDKSSRTARIDPIAAMIDALDRAFRHASDPAPNWSGVWLGPDEDDEGESEWDEGSYDYRETYVERI